MKPSDSFRMHRSLIRRLVEARNARVFGSVVRGDDADGSGLDLIVDSQPGATLLDLGALQVELEEALGIPIDLLTPGDLPPGFRAKVLAEAEPVFCDNHPQLPWKQMRGMRNRMAHGYSDINLEIVWGTISNDLSCLEATIRIVNDGGSGSRY